MNKFEFQFRDYEFNEYDVQCDRIRCWAESLDTAWTDTRHSGLVYRINRDLTERMYDVHGWFRTQELSEVVHSKSPDAEVFNVRSHYKQYEYIDDDFVEVHSEGDIYTIVVVINNTALAVQFKILMSA